VRRLIINADDFGLTAGVNQAIAEAHQRGVVTSATLMAGGRAFEGAVMMAHQMPNLSVGCHVMLVDGQPISRPEQVRSLLAPAPRPKSPLRSGPVRSVSATMSPENRFYDGFGHIAVRSLGGKLNPEQIEEEVESQIRRLQTSGVQVTHVDAHKHTHMLPQIADAIMRAAVRCGVRAIRNPFVPITPLIFAHVLRRPKLWKRYTQVSLLRKYHDDFQKRVERRGMVTTDGSFGVVVTGALDADLFRAIVGSIPEGTWEFVCHPGYNDADLGLVRTRLRESRVKELAVLTSEWARHALAEHHVKLISYRDLIAN
jgi:chitin disaccharide deacetylase